MAEAALAGRRPPSAAAVLEVKGLQAWYNELHILHGVDLDVREGEVVTLLGRNGAGKTTTLKSIMGIVGKRSGSVDVPRPRAHQPLDRPHRPARRRALPGGARHFREPHGQGESVPAARDRQDRRDERRADFRAVSQPARAAVERRRQALGRRAADAGDRPDPAHRRALPDARRADRGPRPGHHPADRPHHRRAQARGLHHPARRAELPLRLDPRRPLLRHGARPDHRRLRQLRASGKDGPCCTRRWGYDAEVVRLHGRPRSSRALLPLREKVSPATLSARPPSPARGEGIPLAGGRT